MIINTMLKRLTLEMINSGWFNLTSVLVVHRYQATRDLIILVQLII